MHARWSYYIPVLFRTRLIMYTRPMANVYGLCNPFTKTDDIRMYIQADDDEECLCAEKIIIAMKLIRRY